MKNILCRLIELTDARLSDVNPKSNALAVKELSDLFTKSRNDLSARYLDDGRCLIAYIANYLIPNAAKVLFCLEKVRRSFDLLTLGTRPLSILDLGSGPGSASLAASLFFGTYYNDTKIQFTCVEGSGLALKEAAALFKNAGNPNHFFEPLTASLNSKNLDNILGNRKFDLIITANFLNELEGDDELFKLCKKLLESHLCDDGLIIIVDPALKKTTMPLMAMRDRIVSENIGCIVAPCLHQKNCPMLAESDRNWCHFYIEWERPELISKMDEAVGTDRRYLKMAYFVMAKRHLPVIPAAVSGNLVGSPLNACGDDKLCWRVVSSPLISKGKRELVLCGVSGELLRVMRQNKNASDTNREFGEVKRGDVVEYGNKNRVEKSDYFRILNRQ